MNYGTSHLISELISAVDSRVHVVVVDNFSTEAERAAITTLVEARQSTTLIGQMNAGYAAGINAASRAAAADHYLLVMNPDVSFEQADLETLIETAASTSLDVASPRIFNIGLGSVWYEGGSISRRTNLVHHQNYGRSPSPTDRQVVTTDFVSGCVLLMSPRARNLLLPMREDLFMYYEDVLLSAKAHTLGLKRGAVIAASFVHDEGATSRGGQPGRSPLYHYYQARNRLLTAAEVTGRSRWPMLTTPWAFLRQVARTRADASPLASIRAVWKGTVDGLRGKAGREQRF